MRKNMPSYLYKHGNASADTTSSSRPPHSCIPLQAATSFAAPSSGSTFDLEACVCTSLNAFAFNKPCSESPNWDKGEAVLKEAAGGVPPPPKPPSTDPPPLFLFLWGPALAAGNAGTRVKPC